MARQLAKTWRAALSGLWVSEEGIGDDGMES